MGIFENGGGKLLLTLVCFSHIVMTYEVAISIGGCDFLLIFFCWRSICRSVAGVRFEGGTYSVFSVPKQFGSGVVYVHENCCSRQ